MALAFSQEFGTYEWFRSYFHDFRGSVCFGGIYCSEGAWLGQYVRLIFLLLTRLLTFRQVYIANVRYSREK